MPARRARLPIVDRLFTRVGASDNLVRGQSTFMVEMSETSAILHTATARSLVLLDEIGRGTSTYDGVSIAWSVSEHLHDAIGCKTVFATHYHEITELTKLADAGEQDFARAYAQWALAIQGYRNVNQAMPLLKTATKADGRVGDEARKLLVGVCLAQLDNYLYDVKQAALLANTVLEVATNETDKAHARFGRAQVLVRNEQSRSKGEQELTEREEVVAHQPPLPLRKRGDGGAPGRTDRKSVV